MSLSLSFDAAEPVRARLAAVLVRPNVVVPTCVGATSTMPLGVVGVGILKASAPIMIIAYVCALLEGPVGVWIRLSPLRPFKIVRNRFIPRRTDACNELKFKMASI